MASNPDEECSEAHVGTKHLVEGLDLEDLFFFFLIGRYPHLKGKSLSSSILNPAISFFTEMRFYCSPSKVF